MLNLRPAAPEIVADPVSEGVPFHPLANLFPLIEGADFVALVEDVRLRGLRQRIVLHQGKILDGRNRYRAAIAAGLLPPTATAPLTVPHLFEEFDEGEHGDALAWVLSLNLNRRHLDESQRAMVAAKLATLGNGRPSGETASLGALSKTAAATLLNVGKASVERAKTLLRSGSSELQQEVEAGRVSVSAAADLAGRPEAEQREIVARGEAAILSAAKRIRADKQAVKRERRLANSAAIARGNGPLPDRRYNVIYLDPAWKFAVRSEETGMDRSADNHYPTLTLDELLALNTGRIAAPDCVMFMWATVPNLLDALAMMKAAGFDYKSHLIWDKDERGTGYWTINQHELLLIGTKGNIAAPLPGTQALSVHREKRGEHSVKPAFFRDMISRLFPDVPKIELFCREPAEGWDVWGNQSGPDESPEEINQNASPAEDLAPVEPPKEITPAKAKKAKKPPAKSPWEIERERVKALAQTLPNDVEGLTSAMAAAIDSFDAAMRAEDVQGVVSARDTISAAMERAGSVNAFGGTCPADRMDALERACAAPAGAIPKWGQAGVFVAEHDGIRALVSFGQRSSTGIHAIDFNAPFPSSTGFLSLTGEQRKTGGSVEDYGASLIAAGIAYNKAQKPSRGLCLPEHIYEIDPAEKRGLRFVRRGEAVDPANPPAGLDPEAALALFAKWEEDDRARWTGGKKGKSRFPERKAHPNDFIAAVTQTGLLPLAEFPTAGAYVMRGWEWRDGQRGHALRYVADAANPVVFAEAAE